MARVVAVQRHCITITVEWARVECGLEQRVAACRGWVVVVVAGSGRKQAM